MNEPMRHRVNQLLLEAISTFGPAKLTRIVIDEYSLEFVTTCFGVQSLIGVTLISDGRSAANLSANFRERERTSYEVLSLVGQVVERAHVQSGKLTLEFARGDRLTFNSIFGEESFLVHVGDVPGDFVFNGEDAGL
jgi:hypothetical protein